MSSRRSFLRSAGGALAGWVACGPAISRAAAESGSQATAGPATQPGASGRARLQKAVSYSMFPEGMTPADRFALAADIGFDGVEIATVDEDAGVGAIRAAADRSGVRVHSVMNAGNWNYPLTSPDEGVARKGLEILRRSIRNAHDLGADTVLVVSAVVTPQVRYQDAWPRSQRAVREVLPLAAERKVTLAIENVGNRFLLSPLEFARYIDEFDSPWVRAYFDIGNSLVLWSYPQDWIRTLGRRICKLHLKDYDQEKKRWAPVGEGDVDWPAVCDAVREIGYRGFVTAELAAGDEAYLRDVARRMDRVLSGLSA